MRNKAMVVAPWCLVAVLFFSGANEAPKPVPEYMKLLLMEERMQTDMMHAALIQSAMNGSSVDIIGNTLIADLNTHIAISTSDKRIQESAADSVEESTKEIRRSTDMFGTLSESYTDRIGDIVNGLEPLNTLRNRVIPADGE